MKLHQELKLILTQEMRLSMNILQMSIPELIEYIEKEKTSNPAIELVYTNNNQTRITKDTSDLSPLDLMQEKRTFADHLQDQLLTISIPDHIKHICIYIINNLDKRGYLPLKEKDILHSLKIKKSDLKAALDIIYDLEPTGVGAVNLRECLKLQIKKKQINNIHVISIIDYFLEDLGDKKFDYIAQKLDISADEVIACLNIIKELNPIPARGFSTDPKNDFIVPEAYIKIDDKNELYVELNKDAFPKIRLNPAYSKNNDEEKNNIQKVLNIMKCIEKRYDTLLKILNIILSKQEKYFFDGKDHLKTLTLQDIAVILGLHQSTISRAIKGKYISTPQGTILIRSLFICNSNSIEIKKIIEDLIKNEDRNNPLSDEQISKSIEKNSKQHIARRTIAKYREELGLGSTRDRKIK